MSKKTETPVFTTEQILRDARFAAHTDALRVVLVNEQYTLAQAEQLLQEFLERKVGEYGD